MAPIVPQLRRVPITNTDKRLQRNASKLVKSIELEIAEHDIITAKTTQTILCGPVLPNNTSLVFSSLQLARQIQHSEQRKWLDFKLVYKTSLSVRGS